MLFLDGAARAYPFFAPRLVPNSIAGPTDPEVAAIVYNPAALGPLRGLHLQIEGSARVHEGSIDRANDAGSAPINWTDFDSFAGLSWDVQTDSFTIGLAVYTPLTDLTSFDPTSPVRYQAMHSRFFSFEQSAAAAFRITSRFYIGAGANFAENWLDYSFARDAALQGGSQLVAQPNALCNGMPCGFENPLAQQTMRLRGFNWGVGFSVGVLVRPVDRLWMGLSYVSHIFNTGRGGDFPLSDATRPRLQPANGQPQVCWNGAGSPGIPGAGSNGVPACNDLVTITIPDMIQLGTRVEINSRFDIEGEARWIHYGERQSIDVSFQGGYLPQVANDPQASVPNRFLLDRGFQDAFAFEVSGRWRIGEHWRLSPSVVFETSAVDATAVNAASIDANKLDVALTAEWKPTRHLRFGGHVGATAFILGDAGQRFDPNAQVACVDAKGDLAACQAYNNGDALPSAAGQYTYVIVHAGLAMGVDF